MLNKQTENTSGKRSLKCIHERVSHFILVTKKDTRCPKFSAISNTPKGKNCFVLLTNILKCCYQRRETASKKTSAKEVNLSLMIFCITRKVMLIIFSINVNNSTNDFDLIKQNF